MTFDNMQRTNSKSESEVKVHIHTQAVSVLTVKTFFFLN